MPKLTIFTSVSALTKTFWADGRKQGSPPFFQGTFEVRNVPGHSALKAQIESLNHHKSNDITGQYIQWNSRQNLMTMRDALEKIQY